MIRSLIFLGFMYFATTGLTQSPVYQSFTIDDGLPGNEVYQVLQDRQGHLWFATDKGLARYDGYNFKTYRKQDGLPGNSVLQIYEDYKGRIWMAIFGGYLAYLEHDSVHTLPLSDSLREQVYYNRVHRLYVSRGDTVWINRSTEQLIYVLPNGYAREVTGTQPDSLYRELRFIPENQQDQSALWDHYLNDIPVKEFLNSRCLVGLSETHILYVNNGYLIEADTSGNRRKWFVGYSLRKFLVEDDSTLWLPTSGTGVIRFSPGLQKQDRFFPGVSITDITRDHEGGYWFSSLEQGVFYCPNINGQHYDMPSNGEVTAIVPLNDSSAWIGLNNGMIVQVSGNRQTGNNLRNNNYNPISYATLDKGVLWASVIRAGLFRLGPSHEWQCIFPEKIGKGENLVRFFSFRKGAIWLLNGQHLWQLRQNGELINKYPISKTRKKIFLRSGQWFNDTLWIGTHNGVKGFYNGEVTDLTNLHPGFRFQIMDMAQWGNVLAMATEGNGLLLYRRGKVRQITEQHGLASNSCSALAAQGDSVLWIATNHGISRLTFSGTSVTPELFNLSRACGLSSNGITAIAIQGNNLWVGSLGGVDVVNTEQNLSHIASIPIHITRILVNGEPDTSRCLEHDRNTIRFFYGAISFNSEILYQYRIPQLDSHWISTMSRDVSFPGLSPGDYTFEVRGANPQTDQRTPVMRYSFAIASPYWNTWWFYTLLFAIVATTLTGIILWRFRIMKLQHGLRHQLIEARQEALLAQMNPHFIFNTLNSIQKFILKKDHYQAHLYLSTFSKMIRTTLENSQKDLISLSEEIETITRYMALEEKRLEYPLKWEIKVDSGIDERSILIPPMLIQPFIENAIWHGIGPADRPGHLSVHFKMKMSFLLCTISDNGIGREASRRLRMELHESSASKRKSMGTKIPLERIQLIYGKKMSVKAVKYSDLVDESGLPSGTTVSILIPVTQV